MSSTETVVYNGVKFRRYPESKRRCDRVYFTPGIADKQRGVKRLHEEVWISENGPIPKGWHVHHLDENPLNNSPTNLQALPRKAHMEHHHKGKCSPAKRAHLEEIRPLTVKWHSSPEGLAWHRDHAYDSIRAIPAVEHVCDYCGKTYKTQPKKKNRFCSNNCRTQARRVSGVDNEARSCVYCGEPFVVNKYAKTEVCSRSCAKKRSWERRKAA